MGNRASTMQRSINLTAGICIALVASSIESGLFHNNALAQEYPGCFLITQLGTLVDLNNLCNITEKQQAEPLMFSGLEFQPPLLGLKPGEIKGAVTNRSNKVIALKVIYVQLVVDNQVIASSDIQIETGSGLQPGESLSFDTIISSKKLAKVPDEEVKVEVTRYE